MRNIVRITCLMAMIGITPAYSNEISLYIPDAKPVGQGKLSVMIWDIYDATLYAPQGIWQKSGPLALKLNYLRSIDGNKIADRSAEEIRDQGFKDEVKLAAWHTQMKKIFPDVENGTSITGILTASGETIFLKDGLEIGRIKDPEFGKTFFDIWLSEKTSAPDLRQDLLGRL